MADLFGDWAFMQNVVVQCLATASFFTYIGGSSFVLETVYGIGQGRYALVFTVNAIAMIAAASPSGSSSRGTGRRPCAPSGSASGMTATIGLIVVALLGKQIVPIPRGALGVLQHPHLRHGHDRAELDDPCRRPQVAGRAARHRRCRVALRSWSARA